MPVISVTVNATLLVNHAELLAAVNIAASHALDLPETGVHSMLSFSQAASTGTLPTEPWPVAIVHGRRRSVEAMRNLVDAVANVLAEFANCDGDKVWVQWMVVA